MIRLCAVDYLYIKFVVKSVNLGQLFMLANTNDSKIELNSVTCG